MPRSPRLPRFLRTPAGWVFALAGAALLLTYCSNDLRGKPPYGTPGDGRYHPQMARGDGHMLFLMTRSIVFDRDLDFDNDLARFGDPWNQPRTKVGQKDVPHPIGPALVWAPVLVVAHGMSKVANLFGAGIPGHGYTMFHQRVVFLSSPLLALMAALFGFLIARRWVGGRWAPLYGVVAALFGTSLLYYATYMPAYGHAMDAGFVGAFLGLWAVRIGELGWRRFVWLGVLLGVCGLIRTQDLSFGIVVAVEVVWLAVGARARAAAGARDRPPVRARRGGARRSRSRCSRSSSRRGRSRPGTGFTPRTGRATSGSLTRRCSSCCSRRATVGSRPRRSPTPPCSACS